MDQINSEILRQFEKQGFTINEGVAIDARLVKSANHPISNEQIKEFKEKMNTPKGKLDKDGKPKKYTRDIDSDWVVKNDKPYYGFKESARGGSIPTTALSWPLPSLLLLSMIPTCFNTVPLSVVTLNSPLKKYTRIKGTPDYLTKNSLLQIKLQTVT